MYPGIIEKIEIAKDSLFLLIERAKKTYPKAIKKTDEKNIKLILVVGSLNVEKQMLRMLCHRG